MSTKIPAPAQTKSGSGQLPTLRNALLAFPIVALLSVIWAFASPLMSVPDEPDHAIKAAAVVRGELTGTSGGKQGDLTTVTVPRYIATLGEQTCYTFKPAETPACAPQLDSGARDLVRAPTSAGNYNPMYYALVGLPSRVMGGAPAVYLMRILNALLGSAFLAVAIGAAATMRRRFWPLVSCLVSITPMVLFLNGSINPNALEVVTTAALFMNLCVVFENYRHLNTVRINVVLVGVSGAVLANTRALSLLWLAFAVLAAVLVFGIKPLVRVLRDGLGIAMTGLLAIGCAASLGWLVVANSFNSLKGVPSTVTPDQAFVTMLDRTFDYSSGYIGIMGWLDTPAPAAVYVFWHFAFAALVLGGLTARPIRGRLGLWILILSIIILPPILQAQVIQEIGYIWQGRYLLALVVLLMLACGVAMRFRLSPRTPWSHSAARWLLVAAVGVHLYVFMYALRRYTVGLQETTNWTEMFDTLWQPPLTWQGLTIAYLMVLTIGAVLIKRQFFSGQPVRFSTNTGDQSPMKLQNARDQSDSRRPLPIRLP